MGNVLNIIKIERKKGVLKTGCFDLEMFSCDFLLIFFVLDLKMMTSSNCTFVLK